MKFLALYFLRKRSIEYISDTFDLPPAFSISIDLSEQFDNFEYLGLFAMSSTRQKIIFGKEKIISFKEIYDLYPQSLIILGKTNEKEKEFLEKMY